jgi:Protein of unknown function (DUF4238)
MGHPRIQHAVPKFLLKNFTAGKKPQVWVYDKQTQKQFITNIKNIATQRGFYDIKVAQAKFSLEPGLALMEAHCSRVFNKALD